MIRALSVALALFLTGACSRVPTAVNPEFSALYEKFAVDVQPFSPQPPVDFTDAFLDVVADDTVKCVQSDDGNYIMVKRSGWERLSPNNQEDTLYRALGRCLYGLPTDNAFTGLCPASIMANFLFGDTPCYRDNAQSYYEKLRQGAT